MHNEAIVFDIQRSSFVDGPGIRTVVFVKGCNMRCVWCHNPESWEREPQILYYENRCIRCMKCVEACPYGALNESLYPDNALCKRCGICVTVCPSDARKLCGEKMSPQSVLDIILKDKAFYDVSGGGATFSGGECMLEPRFLLEVLRLCKQHNIHTAIDTAGHVPYEYFEAVDPYTDLFLYDIKCLDPELHKKFTGKDNHLILENYIKIQKKITGKTYCADSRHSSL